MPPAQNGFDTKILDLQQIHVELDGRVKNLRVEVGTHGVSLHGKAPSFFVKQLVQEFIMRRTSLRINANLISVERRRA